ncbi:uncharacterized protein C8R40DRAFT_1165082 [Lentinula edodes]|uniref:uncharacterized protein n=1 Tax=Lentinula edodes TaxID=5353 RepID=UPI001E8DE372|nr:uncharacterized protein C8R40DRAFT_1165082 [Lentinula edodes]KAH7881673.1 hypothetical protein C8R40DRAFT_1165082 [Lentinula edodes]
MSGGSAMAATAIEEPLSTATVVPEVTPDLAEILRVMLAIALLFKTTAASPSTSALQTTVATPSAFREEGRLDREESIFSADHSREERSQAKPSKSVAATASTVYVVSTVFTPNPSTEPVAVPLSTVLLISTVFASSAPTNSPIFHYLGPGESCFWSATFAVGLPPAGQYQIYPVTTWDDSISTASGLSLQILVA